MPQPGPSAPSPYSWAGRLAGATVIGTASPGNHDYLRDLGAIPVAYGDGLVDRVRVLAAGGVDVALDAVGRASW